MIFLIGEKGKKTAVLIRSLLEGLEGLLSILPLERQSRGFGLVAPFGLLVPLLAFAPLPLERPVELLSLGLLLFHFLLVFEDLLGSELENVGFGETVLADGSEEVLVGVEDA